MTPKRKNEFAGDGSSKVFQLDTTDVDSIIEVKIDDEVQESSKYTLDGENGKVTFTTAPPKPCSILPPLTGISSRSPTIPSLQRLAPMSW